MLIHKYVHKQSLLLLRIETVQTIYWLAMGWMNKDLGIQSWQGQKIFLFFI